MTPASRRKKLYGALRKELGEVLRRLAGQRECKIEEGHLIKRAKTGALTSFALRSHL